MSDNKKRKYKPKVIVLDFDDTIVDFDRGLCNLHNKKYGTCITPNDITDWNFASLAVKDASGNLVKGSELLATFHEYEPEGIYVGLDLLKDAYNALECMKEKGYLIFILTAREDKYGKQTELNLIKNNIDKFIDKAFFKPSDFSDIESFKVKKLKELSKEYNIQVFVDDRAKTVQEVYDNCNVNKVYLIDKRHNKDFEQGDEEEGIMKVKDIMEIIRYLKKVK